jgi:beta-lactamase regulating signal transducer with metallopeptidase domain
MNWQNIFAHSGTADWIFLTAFHLLWISLVAFLILRFPSLRAPTVRSSVCLFTLIMLLALPLITWFVPRLPVLPQPRLIASAGKNDTIAGLNSNETQDRPANKALRFNNLPGPIPPLPEARMHQWKERITQFGFLWFAVALGCIGRLIYELVFLRGFRSSLEEVSDDRILVLLQEINKRYGFRKRARIFISPALTSPISMGMHAPSVILPAGLHQSINDGELRAILLHELAHIYHYDHIVGLLQRFMKALYWWNPLVYRLCNTLSVAREEVSDNYAISGMESAEKYAALLVNLVEKTCLINRLPCTAGMANPYVLLETRIKNLVSKERDMRMKTNNKTTSIIALSTVLLCGLVVMGSRVEVFGIGQTSYPTAATIRDGWFKAGSAPLDYGIGEDRSVYRSGGSSLSLSSIADKPAGFGTIMKYLEPGDFWGKRVRMSAFIKVENITDWAGMWMRVDGEGTNNVLSFDNMQSRPIKGTTDWQQYEIVLDVPEGAINIAFGVLMSGSGKVWLDEVKFDIVGSGHTRTTGPWIVHVDDWSLSGNGPQNYEIGKDFKIFYIEPSSYYLFSKIESTEDFGTIMKTMLPGDYLGKRIRMSAFIKTENIYGWAGMWMRVDGKSGPGQVLAFDNMQNRPIKGTTPWQKYEIVMDVSEEAANIALGVLLHGQGKVWLDEVKFDIVDNQMPTSNILR